MMPLSAEQRRMLFGVNGFLLGMILLLACANLATLLLARTHERPGRLPQDARRSLQPTTPTKNAHR
jgi:hypothetical protein